ncbi:MAG: hypothetical protein AABX99_01135 [Nanoarchaeota archaeon]
MIERQVRYNIKVNPKEPEFSTNRWTFMIIDTINGIKNTEREIYSQFDRFVDTKILYIKSIPSRYLFSKFFSFSTSKGKIEQPAKIHSALSLDKDLAETDDINLERFLQEIIKGKR